LTIELMSLAKLKLVGFGCVLLAMAVGGCTSAKQKPPPQGAWIIQAGGMQNAQGLPAMPPQGNFPQGTVPQGTYPQGMAPQTSQPQGVLNQPQPQTVLVQGPVKNHLLGWTEDLNLATALVIAEYQGVTDPRSIIVVRQGQAYPIDMTRFLRGRENPVLMPGDVIQLGF
jgi:hypothetical protein